jgi:allantoinase
MREPEAGRSAKRVVSIDTAPEVAHGARRMPDLALVSRRVATPEGVRPAAVLTEAGRIAAVVAPQDAPSHAEDLGDLALLPGLVDSHVHVNEPGRTHWEGFATATRAAAAGGVTTLVDMPLNSLPPTTSPAALAEKREAAAGKAHVDVAFWGGAVPGALEHLGALHAEGVLGFKAFLCDSGVEEYGHFPPEAIGEVLARTAALDALLIVHAEDPRVVGRATGAVAAAGDDPRRYATWLASRPPEAEVEAIAALLDAVRRTGGRVHVLHLSAAAALPLLAAARAEGLPVTVETCPHYLALAAEDVPDGATDHKCAPPIRDRANADGLWAGLADGTIDAIVSDHSPCPPEDKVPDSGDFIAAWGGIASLQLGLPIVWTAAAERGHGLADVVRWMAEGPARLAGLDRKGAIRPGADADLVVLDPDTRWTVEGAALHHRHPVTPYEGRTLRGRVEATYLRGRRIDGAGGSEPAGRLLRREAT